MQQTACMAAADLPAGVYVPPDEHRGLEEAAMLQRKHAKPLAMPEAITAITCTEVVSLCIAH